MDKLQSLAVMQRLLRDLGGGLLADQIAAISKRLDQLAQHRRLNLGEAVARLKFPAVASRPAGEAFQVAASATLQRGSTPAALALSWARSSRHRSPPCWFLLFPRYCSELRIHSIDRPSCRSKQRLPMIVSTDFWGALGFCSRSPSL
jgi:hypothetical protein